MKPSNVAREERNTALAPAEPPRLVPKLHNYEVLNSAGIVVEVLHGVTSEWMRNFAVRHRIAQDRIRETQHKIP